MKLYYVYIILCADNTFYIGITNNIDRRWKEHKYGLNKNSYTYDRRPLKLEFYQEFLNVEQAIYFEKKIKKWSHSKKQALIDNDAKSLKKLAECRNETHFKNFKRRETDEKK